MMFLFVRDSCGSLYFASVLGVSVNSWSWSLSSPRGLSIPPFPSFLLKASMMFLFVRDSCGSLYSVYLRRTLSISVLAYWYNLLLLEKIMRAISQSQRIESSYAFFITPNFRLLNVTCLFLSSVIREICIFFLPIVNSLQPASCLLLNTLMFSHR